MSKKDSVARMQVSKTGISTNSHYYIEKLEYMKDLLKSSGEVPPAYIDPIEHELKKIKTMFDNVLMFLPDSAN